MEKVLLIGGAGFIGHNLALKLKKKFRVYIVDFFKINNLGSLSKVKPENRILYNFRRETKNFKKK